MKKKLALAFIASGLVAMAIPAFGADVVGDKSYFGTINAVIPGFYGQVGVELAEGMSCRGSRQVILLKSNPMYSEILSILITAQINKTPVKLARLAWEADANGFCTITEAALGAFSAWPT